MGTINNKEFFESLENFKSLNIWNIQKELNFATATDGKWDNNVLTERKVLFTNVNKGELVSNSFTTNVDGSINGKLSFSDEEYKYLENRIQETQNSLLKSRYAHLLWDKTKHVKYAEIALENYLKSIHNIKDGETGELTILASAIFFISKKSKLEIENVRKLAMDLLSNMPVWVRGTILADVLQFNLLERKQLIHLANNIAELVELENPAMYSWNQTNLNTALTLFKKLNKETNIIYSLLAKNEDLIIKQHPNDEDFVKITSVGNKACYLKLAKEEKEYNLVMCEYNRLKQKVKLNKISVPLDEETTQRFNDFLNLKTKYLLTFDTESILAFFSMDEELLVNSKSIQESMQIRAKSSIKHLFSITAFDINTNFKVLTDIEKIDQEVFNSYIVAHNIQVHTLFLKVMTQGIITGKLNYYKVFDFLKEHSWYGQKIKRSISTDKDDNSSWLSLLAPGLQNLFAQYELSVLLNTSKVNNFILAIDSLTLKFEGMVRDFIRLSGGHTSKRNKHGEIKEQLLEELLENEIIQKYFTKKDVDLFKVTFTSRGKNIRNNVAHCFMEFPDYNFQVVILVFLCILRLGKYTLEEGH